MFLEEHKHEYAKHFVETGLFFKIKTSVFVRYL